MFAFKEESEILLKKTLTTLLKDICSFRQNDYERIIDAHGIPKKRIHATIHHNNSSTIAAGYGPKNAYTFSINQRLFEERKAENNLNGGEWSLKIRRENSWD